MKTFSPLSHFTWFVCTCTLRHAVFTIWPVWFLTCNHLNVYFRSMWAALILLRIFFKCTRLLLRIPRKCQVSDNSTQLCNACIWPEHCNALTVFPRRWGTRWPPPGPGCWNSFYRMNLCGGRLHRLSSKINKITAKCCTCTYRVMFYLQTVLSFYFICL